MIFNIYRLEDITDKIGDGIHGTPGYDDNGDFYFVNGNNLVHGDIVFKNDTKRINEEQYLKNKRDLNKNTLLVSINGTLGNVAKYNNEKIILGKSACYINVKDEYNVDYVYFVFESPKFKKYLQYGANGTTIKNVPLSAIRNYEISIPSKENQDKIVKILKSIEDKIKLNNKINNNLYEISKQLLLKYLDENKSSDEINISKFLNIFTGKKNANETSPTGKYKFFSCAPESLLSDTYLCDSAAIIVAGNGAYTGRTRFYDGKFELYQRTYGLTLKDDFEKNNIYGLYVFMKTIFEPDKMGGTHGSAIPYIVLSDLTDYKLKYNKVEFDRFSNLVSGNIKMIQENEKSNEKLSELRDTLLPKLINGEIDLDNIEI